ncbi:hypothetical protein [Azonexus sp.]|uniref:hypothetical protein n=1 Tax=Azonexus sp. TaxID=1872668 RepID=UPI00283523B7|nr:hypothetical protein [Azonexus sp.]MDR1995160.1 hypothetical protein [Azonexus sp.]
MIADIDSATDVIEYFGDPWHGKVIGNTLTLPNGQTRPVPGETPIGGDCFMVQIPGQPAISATPEQVAEDSAAGRTWLNHGLMAGENHCIYGSALGPGRWIYIDPTGTPWLASISGFGLAGFDLSFRRFGLIPASPEESQVAQTEQIDMTGLGVGTYDHWQIDDIKKDGSGVLVVMWQDVPRVNGTDLPPLTRPRLIRGGFEITISGVPPAAVCETTGLLSAGDAYGEYLPWFDDDNNHIEEEVFPGYAVDLYVTTELTFSDSLINLPAGLCYDKAGNAQKVVFGFIYNESNEATYDGGVYSVTGQGSGAITLGISPHQIEFNISLSSSGYIDPSSMKAGIGSATVTTPLGVTERDAAPSYLVDYTQNKASLAPGNTITLYRSAGFVEFRTNNGYFYFYPVRLGNGLFGLVHVARHQLTGAPISAMGLYNLIHPDGVTDLQVIMPYIFSRLLASRQPVTGDVATQVDGENLCFR